MPNKFVDDQEEKLTLSLEEAEKYNRLVNRVVNHLDWCKGSSDRQEFEKRCTDAQNFWRGKQWNGIASYGIPGRSAARKKVKPSPIDNFFFSQTEGIVGDVCEQPADIIINPMEETDEEIAALYSDVAQHIWAVNRGDKALKFQVRRGVLYGPLVAKVYWDTDWAGGVTNPFVGEVRITMFPATQLFVDPRIRAVSPGVLQEARFVVYGVRRSLAQIKESYPERGGAVSADSYASYVSTLDDDEGAYSVDPEDSSALVIEYYYKGKPLAPKFPENLEYDEFKDNLGGGVHLAVVAGNELLRHVPYIAPKYPFVLEWMYPSDDSIYCYGDGHHMLLPQLIINKSNEIAVEGNAIQAYGNWITDEGNIRDVASFQRLAQTGGAVLTFVDSNRARRDMAGGVANSVFNQYGQSQRAMETVTGRLDISQGRAPRGIRAASAISMLLSQAAGRTKSRSDVVSSFVQQIMELALSTAGKYYSDERTLRMKGPSGKNIWQTISADNMRKIKYWTNPSTGLVEQEEYIPDLDIKVIAGAETPTSRAYYAEMATELFKAGVIDQEALLETHKFPKWREVMARMKAAQQPQGMPPGVPPGMPPGMEGMMPPGMPPGVPPGMENIPQELLDALVQEGQAQGTAPSGLEGIPPEILAELLQGGEASQTPPQGLPPGLEGMAPEELIALITGQGGARQQESDLTPEMLVQILIEEGVPPELILQILAQMGAGIPEQNIPQVPSAGGSVAGPYKNIGGSGDIGVLGGLIDSLQRAKHV